MTLYHASPLSRLPIITPQPTLSRDKYIGDFVFATKNKRLALMYLVPKGFATLMNSQLSNPNIVICGKVKDVIKKDKGGSLYWLSDEYFQDTPQAGLSEYEMVSEKPVIPFKEVSYENTIETLINGGISIYFTNESTFNSLLVNDKQQELIQKLPKYQ